VLARAYWEDGDHAVALGIGLAARDGLAAFPGYEQELAVVEAWLRAQCGTLPAHPRRR